MKKLLLYLILLGFALAENLESDYEKIQGYWRFYMPDSSYYTLEFEDSMVYVNRYALADPELSYFTNPASFKIKNGLIRIKESELEEHFLDSVPYAFLPNSNLKLHIGENWIGKKYDKEIF